MYFVKEDEPCNPKNNTDSWKFTQFKQKSKTVIHEQCLFYHAIQNNVVLILDTTIK
jgi:hypothetical protein